MSHQDKGNGCTSGQTLKDIFQFLLPSNTANTTRHGNASVDGFSLAAIAIACWGWSTKRTLSQRVEEASAAVKGVFPNCQTVSRQGLCQALKTCGNALFSEICSHIQRRLQKLNGYWKTAGKPTFAVDGTKVAAPRTTANQERFAASKKHRKKYKRRPTPPKP